MDITEGPDGGLWVRQLQHQQDREDHDIGYDHRIRHGSTFDADALLPPQCLSLYDVTEAVRQLYRPLTHDPGAVHV
jgi:hypothetical protein